MTSNDFGSDSCLRFFLTSLRYEINWRFLSWTWVRGSSPSGASGASGASGPSGFWYDRLQNSQVLQCQSCSQELIWSRSRLGGRMNGICMTSVTTWNNVTLHHLASSCIYIASFNRFSTFRCSQLQMVESSGVNRECRMPRSETYCDYLCDCILKGPCAGVRYTPHY